MVDGNLRKLFDDHPLITQTSASAGKRGPSYLSATIFSKALLDLVTPTVPGPVGFVDVQAGVLALPEGDVKKTLIALMSDSGGELNKLRSNIEEWFDEAMDRAGGSFKRHSQAWAIAIAALLTVVTNADTLAIGQKLWENPSLRAEAVKLAEKRAEMPRPTVEVEYTDPDDPLKPSASKAPKETLTTEEESILGKLIGWEKPVTQYSIGELFRHLAGWALTAIAVSLGAPFWFDVLNRFMKVRNAGHKPPKGKEEDQSSK